MVRSVVRRDRLEAYPALRQGVFAVGAGTRCIDVSFPLSRHGLSFRKPTQDAGKQHILSRRDNPIVAWHEVPGTTPLERTVP